MFCLRKYSTVARVHTDELQKLWMTFLSSSANCLEASPGFSDSQWTTLRITVPTRWAKCRVNDRSPQISSGSCSTFSWNHKTVEVIHFVFCLELHTCIAHVLASTTVNCKGCCEWQNKRQFLKEKSSLPLGIPLKAHPTWLPRVIYHTIVQAVT